MENSSPQEHPKLSWSFPATFWYANGAELCERAAYYGMFITLFRYLDDDVGFTTVQTGWITAAFSSILYFLPTFMGILADKIGFKQALMLAFVLLTGGYALLGTFQIKFAALLALTLILFGGAIVKPVISGTAAKCSDGANRARAMSIFYMVVNIGSFSGKGLAGYLNEALGLQYINFYAAGMSFTALLLVSLFYRNPDMEGTGKTVTEALRGLRKVMANFRFLSLILIIGGFWAIQGQLYGAMPTYIERLLGTGYKPEWLANINPLVVVLLVVPITNLIRNFKPANAIGIGLLIIPFTALLVSLSPVVERATGSSVDLGFVVLHPMIMMFIIGIGLQGLAECFLSPKWLEFASKQAPKAEVGLYLGYSHLTTFFAWLFGFILAGYLLTGFCPDPKTLSPEARHQWRQAIDPHYRFILERELAGELSKDGVVSDAVRAGFSKQGITLDADVRLKEAEPAGEWKSDAVAAWTLSAGERTYTLVHVESKIEKKQEADDRSIFARARAFLFDSQEDTFAELLVLDDRATPAERMAPLPEQYGRAHYIWYVFTGIGALAFAAMLVFKFVTGRIDARSGGEAKGA
ncbi:MAG: MFS transporter [Planctomycetota bacterium]